MKSLLLLFFAILFCIPASFALTNTWIGGWGYWEVASNWSLGTVPTLSDDVEIPSGGIKITTLNAVANSVNLESSAELIIPKATRLSVRGGLSAYGMWIKGTVDISGYLLVEQLNSAYSINMEQSGNFYVWKSGVVNIRDMSGIAFRNVGEIINRGFFYMADGGNNGILNYGMVKNLDGEIAAYNLNGVALYGYDSPSIPGSGSLINEGEINVRGAGGIVVPDNASGVNAVGAEIYISYTTGGITVEEGALFENYSDITILQTTSTLPGALDGIINRGKFFNYIGGAINIDGIHLGIYNGDTGLFQNEGFIDLGSSIINNSIKNVGDFGNITCGTIKASKSIFNEPNAEITNKGWIYNYSTSNATNYGVIDNNGTIEDNPETLYPYINNNGIVTRPLTGTVEVGTPVSNALELGSLSSHNVIGWYVNIYANNSAGTYNASTNEWTPNAAATGLNSVYVKIQNTSDGCQEVFEVEVPGGVQPFSAPDEESFAIQKGIYDQASARLQLYPNPSKGQVNVVLAVEYKNAQKLQVYNALGTLVLEQNLNREFAASFHINLTDQPAGMYWVQLHDNKPIGIPQAIVITK